MSIYASIEGIGDYGDPEHLGQPWVYAGSHVLPREDGPRGGAVGFAVIPSHITRDGRDDQPADGAPWPWLRLHLDVPSGDPCVLLDAAQARFLAAQLAAWADRVEGRLADEAATEATDDPELTADEARALVDELGLDLYRAQDTLAYVHEWCDLVDREQRPITTGDVREWLKGDRCTRQRAADATGHRYLSTGCLHGRHDYCSNVDGIAGLKKPAQCKFCSAPCQCRCHQEQPDA